jgi:hypothetical protein
MVEDEPKSNDLPNNSNLGLVIQPLPFHRTMYQLGFPIRYSRLRASVYSFFSGSLAALIPAIWPNVSAGPIVLPPPQYALAVGEAMQLPAP